MQVIFKKLEARYAHDQLSNGRPLLMLSFCVCVHLYFPSCNCKKCVIIEAVCAFVQVSNGRPLSMLSFALFKRFEFAEKWQMDDQKLAKFLMKIEDGCVCVYECVCVCVWIFECECACA